MSMANKAVLTGINDYQHISDLRGCINDVHNIRRLLLDMFGFTDENIHILTDNKVTKERILKEWKWLIKNAKPGDNLVFHFSGHGSYIKDLDGDEEDGVDELLCLYDMDFHDSDTYLLDDDMRRLTQQVPDGVYLTVILDQCHAGTATRLLFSPDDVRAESDPEKMPLVDEEATRRRSPGHGFRSLSLSEMPDRERVLARFVQPPPEVLRAVARGRIHSRFARDAVDGEAEMNHVLWAASRDNQTAADAYIDNDFHGAFTYHFCQSVRSAGHRVEHQDLIETVRSTLARSSFAQEPQLEPRTTRGPLLRWYRDGAGGGTSSGSRPSEASGTTGHELLQVLREIRDELRAGRGGRETGSRAANRALVYVHGICHHDETYAEPWWQSLRPHLPAHLQAELDRNRHAVLWSDLVNRTRSEDFADTASERRQEQDLAEQVKEILKDRAERQAVEVVPPQEPDETPHAWEEPPADRALLGIPGLDCVDDFMRYLFNSRIRDAIQRRFTDAVIPLLRSGATIDVISHSWGTVVAYESLRRLDGESFRGQVQTFFTVGAALAILPIRRMVRPRDGARPRHVQQWVNLNARGDIVGGPLRGFQVDREFLNLHPSECGRIVTASCAHSSYFRDSNVAVNRDIFARFVRS